MSEPVYFGVRHLSPAGAFHLRRLLNEVKPDLVLVEGPSDLNEQMQYITHPETKPPIAMLAYTQKAPVRSILYPLAVYSPEYQAILWSHENHVPCRFMDLPSDVFLALQRVQWTGESEGEDAEAAAWRALDQQSGEGGYETFWERTLEHTTAPDAYRRGTGHFGAQLREMTAGRSASWPETVVREAFMRRVLDDAQKEGFQKIVVVTGAFHVEGLKTVKPMTDRERKRLPRDPSSQTLMPYSYYRLSTRSGYGAGNKAPAYFERVWESLERGGPDWHARCYLAGIAGDQRKFGNPVSSAEVIEAVRLADELAHLRGSGVPVLHDLRDAAVTCLGRGSFSAISMSVARMEIGTEIGALPDGVSRTSIQTDFYRQLKELKLERYRSVTAQDISLDLRENRRVKSQKAAFLDLNRSSFLHQLKVLGVSFGEKQQVRQDSATWAESWILCWTPEAEIELVESALKGDTVAQAASFAMKERVEQAAGMSEIASVIEDAFTCGMAEAVQYATTALQGMAVDAASLEDLAATAHRLSMVLQYGTIRRLDPAPLEPILKQLFLRCCLILPGCCSCDDGGSKPVQTAIEQLNSAALGHEFLDSTLWTDTLDQVATRDDLNTKLSGYAAAILLERGVLDAQRLALEVQRRLSRGTPAELGAGWFEGLSLRNRSALIARLSLWRSLSEYLDSLDDEEFKRALVFLRRAFADFSAGEKDAVAENLGEIWGLNQQQVSEVLNAPVTEDVAADLGGFDFGDFDFGDF